MDKEIVYASTVDGNTVTRLKQGNIQGAETAMLASSRELLRGRRVRFVFVSTHHVSISGDPATHEHCLAMVRECEAHVIAEHSPAESWSGDGLIVVYCACPNEASAARIAKMLKARGFTRVRPLAGGIEDWVKAGHRIELAGGDPVLQARTASA